MTGHLWLCKAFGFKFLKQTVPLYNFLLLIFGGGKIWSECAGRQKILIAVSGTAAKTKNRYA
jgi:hypothetical protein